MSWTLRKKLDTFAGPGGIKRREVVLDPQVSPEEMRSRAVELGLRVGLLLHQLFSAVLAKTDTVKKEGGVFGGKNEDQWTVKVEIRTRKKKVNGS